MTYPQLLLAAPALPLVVWLVDILVEVGVGVGMLVAFGVRVADKYEVGVPVGVGAGIDELIGAWSV